MEKSMKRGIAFAGSLLVDYVKLINCYPEIGALAAISDVSRSVGGCAANTSVDLAVLDPTIPVQAIGVVGLDEDGDFVIRTLQDHHVQTDKIIRDPNYHTSFTDVMSIESTGERTFFNAAGANTQFTIPIADLAELDADILHIGYIMLLDRLLEPDAEHGVYLAGLLKEAQKLGIKTSIDLSSGAEERRMQEILLPCLEYCNYVIVNELEASLLSGVKVRGDDGKIIDGAVPKICEVLMKHKIKDRLIIHAPEGGWMATSEGGLYYEPSLLLPSGFIKGSVGAGDAYCAGALYGIYEDFSPEFCLQFSAACAAASLSSKNSIDGMRPYSQVITLLLQYQKAHL